MTKDMKYVREGLEALVWWLGDHRLQCDDSFECTSSVPSEIDVVSK